MSQISAGSCTRCTRSNAFPVENVSYFSYFNLTSCIFRTFYFVYKYYLWVRCFKIFTIFREIENLSLLRTYSKVSNKHGVFLILFEKIFPWLIRTLLFILIPEKSVTNTVFCIINIKRNHNCMTYWNLQVYLILENFPVCTLLELHAY